MYVSMVRVIRVLSIMAINAIWVMRVICVAAEVYVLVSWDL
jgi:hypothetical protein